jgi:transcriptional antiterminator RfaH
MENTVMNDGLRWYVIRTNSKQESRADSNLKTLGIETFSPRVKECRYNAYSGEKSYIVKPFFPGYIFARVCHTHFHKVHFTRGVRAIVHFGNDPAPVDDSIIDAIRSRTEADDCIRLDKQLKPGDRVIIEGGPLQNISGIFERETTGDQRVVILLEAVSYQARLEIARENLRKLTD